MSITTQSSDDVSFRHPDYITHAQQLDIINNIYNGVDSSVGYIYQMERESAKSLELRKQKATLKNFVRRAVDAFVGMIYRKPIETTGLDDTMSAIISKIDKKNSLNRFARDITTALVRDSRVFIGADTSTTGKDAPYGVIYPRASVINWAKDGDGKYTMIVVQEQVEVRSGEFGIEYIDQWRVYKEDGNIDLYRTIDSKNTLYESIITEYDYIPMIEIDIGDVPPLYDIAKLTIKHFNRTSLKDKYIDMCSVPIPLIWGMDINDGDATKPALIIGADEAFIFTGTKAEADFEWRELTGSSIDKLQEDLKVIEEDITSGILRAATNDSKTIKTATQSFYEAAESSNRVTVIANAVEQGLNQLLVFLADLGNIKLDATSKIIVNKDFNAILQSSDSLRLLFEVYLAGAVSIETFLDSLTKFEVIDISSVRDELTRIKADTFVPEPKVKTTEVAPTIDNRTKSLMANE
jgi:hypothetical protein